MDGGISVGSFSPGHLIIWLSQQSCEMVKAGPLLRTVERGSEKVCALPKATHLEVMELLGEPRPSNWTH